MASHGKKIHQCKFSTVVERVTLTLPKSQCHLTRVSLSPLIHPSIHPFLPVSTVFAFYSHIKPPSLFPLRPFSLLNCLCVTLSHVSLNSFNPQFASDTSRRPPAKRQRATGQALKTACVHTNTVSYLNCSAR